MCSATTLIYIDECGHTGVDLLNAAQPFLVTSSLRFTEAEAIELLAPLKRVTQADEVKYSNLSGRPRGQQAILQLFNKLDAQQDRVLFQLMHKRYALLGKLLDHVLEPYCLARGVDFYRDGRNLAMTNVMYLCGNAFDRARFDSMLAALQTMFRNHTQQSVREAHQSVVELSRVGPEMRKLCGDILDAFTWRSGIPNGWATMDRSDLELQNASLFSLALEWNSQIDGDLVIVADESSELRSGLDVLKAFSDPDGPSPTVVGGRRKASLPLRIADIRLVDSKMHPGVQLADIAAGAMTHAYQVLNECATPVAGYSTEVLGIVSKWERVLQVVPHAAVTSKELDRENYDGAAFLNAGVERLAQARKRQAKRSLL